jgi:hypothetical protein
MTHAIDWQAWIAATLVIGALAHLAWRLLPRALRARWSRGGAGERASACGGCDACGPGDSSCSPAREFTVPADAIGGRRASSPSRARSDA